MRAKTEKFSAWAEKRILGGERRTMYERIRDLRKDFDLSQKRLAEHLNCSQVCYSRYELGKRDIPVETLSRLADFYRTSIDYLIGRTDQRDPYPPNK